MAGSVPDRQCEHPPQEREHPGPLVLVEMNQDFGIALRAEGVTSGLEPAPQRGEVVDLAIEDGPDGAVLIGERLMPSRQIDDRQPAKPERGMIVAIDAGIVRPAVSDPVHHRLQVFGGEGIPGVSPDRAADSAHAESPQRYGRDGTARPKKHITAEADRFVRTFPGNAIIKFTPTVLFLCWLCFARFHSREEPTFVTVRRSRLGWPLITA